MALIRLGQASLDSTFEFKFKIQIKASHRHSLKHFREGLPPGLKGKCRSAACRTLCREASRHLRDAAMPYASRQHRPNVVDVKGQVIGVMCLRHACRNGCSSDPKNLSEPATSHWRNVSQNTQFGVRREFRRVYLASLHAVAAAWWFR